MLGLSLNLMQVSPFVPRQLPNLALFLESLDKNTLTLSGSNVTQWNDKSGNDIDGTQSTSADQPTYDGTYVITTINTFPRTDFLNFTIPTGGISGTMIQAFEQGTIAVEVEIPAGNYEIGGYLADDKIVGIALYDRTLSEAEKNAVINYFIAKGAGGVDGWSTVGNFRYSWREQDITEFPLIDMSSATILEFAFSTNKLTDFPLIDTSNVSNFGWAWQSNNFISFPALDFSGGNFFRSAWLSCTSLTNFPANMFDSLSSPSDGCFNGAWFNCNLNATSMENILVSIDTSGASAPASLVDITIGSNGDAVTSDTLEAMYSLIGKGWTITIDGVLFDSDDIAEGWFDFADTDTITSVSNDVSQILNKGDDPANATQSTTSAQPLTGTRTINGLNVLEFTGNEWLTLGTPNLGSTGLFADSGEEFTVFAIGQTDDIGTSSGGYFISKHDGTLATFGKLHFRDEYNCVIRGTVTTIKTPIASGDSLLSASVWNGSTMDLYFKGGTAISGSVGTQAEATTQNINIGARTDGTGFRLDGTVAEIIVFDKALSTAKLNFYGKYLANKWGITWTTIS